MSELDGDKNKSIFDTERLGAVAQSLLEDQDESEAMASKKLELIEKVNDKFNA